MKKIGTALALLLAVGAASAADLTVKYDYDQPEGAPYSALNRVTTSIGYGFGALGAVDAGFVTAQLAAGGVRLNGIGYDVGYSNGLKVGAGSIGGRVGFSQINGGTLSYLNPKLNTLSVALNGSYPLSPKLNAIAGVEHVRSHVQVASGLSDTFTGNRGTIGLEYAVAKNVSVKASYARLHGQGEDANGFTTALKYSF